MTCEKQNVAKRAFCLLLIAFSICLIFTTTMVDAEAAGTTTYIVTTKANYWYPGQESITIKQSQEQYYSATKKIKKRNMAYKVTCVPISWNGKKPKTITKTFTSGSRKIDLEKNVTYRVTISKDYANPYNTYGNFGVVKSGYAYISKAHKATYR